jgi:hypothetical protein
MLRSLLRLQPPLEPALVYPVEQPAPEGHLPVFHFAYASPKLL